MIAGTLIVLKDCGTLPGYLMRRGTIVLANPPELAPTFVDAESTNLPSPKFSQGCCETKAVPPRGFLDARSRGSLATWRRSEKAKSFFPVML